VSLGVSFDGRVRQGRITAPGLPDFAYYHCVSRVVDRRRVFGETEKDHFMELMREYEAFCGVGAVTFIVMSNHFHVLLKVPRAPAQPLSDEQLLQRIEALTGTAGGESARQELTRFRERGQHEAAEALRQRFLARMWNLSAFMKLLKQRFTQWFNKHHERQGTLWEGRFKSVLVESAGQALGAMAAYIDLNSVRAGLVADPMHYRWCGYAQALAGQVQAQEGLCEIMAGAQRVAPGSLGLDEALRHYRMYLFQKGQQRGVDAQGRPLRKGFTPEAVLRVMLQEGQVPVCDYVRLRVRYFVDGVVMGTRQFVDEVFQAYRRRFGPKRKDGARRMRGVACEGLYVLRDLRRNVIGFHQPMDWGDLGTVPGTG
jgi:putative transposase